MMAPGYELLKILSEKYVIAKIARSSKESAVRIKRKSPKGSKIKKKRNREKCTKKTKTATLRVYHLRREKSAPIPLAARNAATGQLIM